VRLKIDTNLVKKFRNILMPPGSVFYLKENHTINQVFEGNFCKEHFPINFCGEHDPFFSVIANAFAIKSFSMLQDICSLILKKKRQIKIFFLSFFLILGLKLWLG